MLKNAETHHSFLRFLNFGTIAIVGLLVMGYTVVGSSATDATATPVEVTPKEVSGPGNVLPSNTVTVNLRRGKIHDGHTGSVVAMADSGAVHMRVEAWATSEKLDPESQRYGDFNPEIQGQRQWHKLIDFPFHTNTELTIRVVYIDPSTRKTIPAQLQLIYQDQDTNRMPHKNYIAQIRAKHNSADSNSGWHNCDIFIVEGLPDEFTIED